MEKKIFMSSLTISLAIFGMPFFNLIPSSPKVSEIIQA